MSTARAQGDVGAVASTLSLALSRGHARLGGPQDGAGDLVGVAEGALAAGVGGAGLRRASAAMAVPHWAAESWSPSTYRPVGHGRRWRPAAGTGCGLTSRPGGLHRRPFHRHHQPRPHQPVGEELLQQRRIVDGHPVGRRQGLDHGRAAAGPPTAASATSAATHGEAAVNVPRPRSTPNLGSGPTKADHSRAGQRRELLGTQRRRPAGQAFHEGLEPAAEARRPRTRR